MRVVAMFWTVCVFGMSTTSAEVRVDNPVVKKSLTSEQNAATTDEKGVFGVGPVIGKPVGITMKYYLSDNQAIAVTGGAAFETQGWQISSDWQWHPLLLDTTDSYALPLYLGAGMQYRNLNQPDPRKAIGLRATVGLAFDFRNAPIDAFFEITAAPELRFGDVDTSGIWLNAAVGSRYYF